MLYCCNRCHFERAAGFLPTTTCGFLVIPPMAIGIVVVRILEVRTGTSLGWWWLPVGLATVYLAPAIFILVLAAIEWCGVHGRRCPDCGARSWSFGYTKGFGL
jgi:hypothetical protein